MKTLQFKQYLFQQWLLFVIIVNDYIGFILLAGFTTKIAHSKLINYSSTQSKFNVLQFSTPTSRSIGKRTENGENIPNIRN